MELSYDRKGGRSERLAFVRSYAAWVRKTPNAEWSRQQAVLIDSLFLNGRNTPISREQYLERVVRRRATREPVIRS